MSCCPAVRLRFSAGVGSAEAAEAEEVEEKAEVEEERVGRRAAKVVRLHLASIVRLKLYDTGRWRRVGRLGGSSRACG